MLVAQDLEPPASFCRCWHVGPSLTMDHNPGFASQIVLELCLFNHPDPDPPPSTSRRNTQGLLHDLATKPQEISRKLFEAEYPKSIGIVSPAFFVELHQIVVKLSTCAPLDMAPLVSDAQDIHGPSPVVISHIGCSRCGANGILLWWPARGTFPSNGS